MAPISSRPQYDNQCMEAVSLFIQFDPNTVKPVYNDHLYDKIYYLWFIQ